MAGYDPKRTFDSSAASSMPDPESDTKTNQRPRLSTTAFWVCVAIGVGLLVLVWIPTIYVLIGDYRRSESDPMVLAIHIVMLIVAIYVTVSGTRFIRRFRPDALRGE